MIQLCLQSHPGHLHIAVAVVEYSVSVGKEKKQKHGLCSTFLAGQTVGSRVALWVRPGTMRLPRRPSPVIMVGPGTGVAPFRSFVAEMHHLRAQLSQMDALRFPKMILFFGCRHSQKDYLYEDDWRTYVSQGTLSMMVTAFSRDQEAKVYVQHRIREHGSALVRLLTVENAHVYVCGYVGVNP